MLILIGIIALGLGYQHYRSQRILHQAEVQVESFALPAAESPVAAPGVTSEGEKRPSSVEPDTLDLNQATAAELETLRGIGPVKAAAIVEYREQIGGFNSVEELVYVPGIGEATLEALRPQVTIAAPAPRMTLPSPTEAAAVEEGVAPGPGPLETAPVNINTATVEELKTLYRIGDTLAERIIEYRQQHGPFQRPEDLTHVSGIGPKILEANRHRITVR